LKRLFFFAMFVILFACVAAIGPPDCVPKPHCSPSPSPSPSGFRSLIRGLGNRDQTPQVSEYPTTLKVQWSALQPGLVEAPFVHPNPIDDAIASGEAFRVRIMGGIYAPPWAKAVAGMYETYDPPACDTVIGTVPRWWDPDFIAAYDRTIAHFEAEYGGEPLVKSLVLFSPMVQFADFIRGFGCEVNRQNFTAAGGTFEKDKAALYAALDSHERHLTYTRTILSVAPWQYVFVRTDGGLGVNNNMPETLAAMDYCRQVMGLQCILQNNSIRWYDSNGDGQPDFGPAPVSAYDQIFDHMVFLGAPFSFQTAESAKFNEHPGILDDTVQHACDIGANYVELPGNYDSHLTEVQKVALDTCLKGNV
jgi:hypothetical protein